MNKLNIALTVALAFNLTLTGMTAYMTVKTMDNVEALQQTDNNVGNGQTYNYVVTEINGDEINGLPLNKVSDGNRGIFLLKDELSFDVKVGDKVAVVWGEYEDEFKSIKKIQ